MLTMPQTSSVSSATTDAGGAYHLDLPAQLPAAPDNFVFNPENHPIAEPSTAIVGNGDFARGLSTLPGFQNAGFNVGMTVLPTTTYPANYDFTQGLTALPTTTYPTNYDFSTGDLTGWTPSDPNTVGVISDTANLAGP